MVAEGMTIEKETESKLAHFGKSLWKHKWELAALGVVAAGAAYDGPRGAVLASGLVLGVRRGMKNYLKSVRYHLLPLHRLSACVAVPIITASYAFLGFGAAVVYGNLVGHPANLPLIAEKEALQQVFDGSPTGYAKKEMTNWYSAFGTEVVKAESNVSARCRGDDFVALNSALDEPIPVYKKSVSKDGKVTFSLQSGGITTGQAMTCGM